jgi:uncharacterized protein YjbI with pentapeptide repeats
MDPTVEASLIGAAAALIGVGGTVIVAVTAAQNTRRTNQNTIDAARADAQLALDATREAQFADRYSRALEQLGSGNLDIRIGGIYALEGIALDSPRHHPTVVEVLAAFIREHSRTPDAARPERWPLPDVQTALTVLGRRNKDHDRPDRRVHLDGADLTGANLRRANLGNAALSRAQLSGADLHHADLKHADLNHADLTDADLAVADMTGANLDGAHLGGANLRDADLASAQLRAADLSKARLTRAQLSGADLTGACLTDAILRDTTLVGANLTHAKLGQRELTRADLMGAELTGARWPHDVKVPKGWTRAEGGTPDKPTMLERDDGGPHAVGSASQGP